MFIIPPANAGGLISLTLGMSIISFVEIFYFFTLRAWYQNKDDKAKEDNDDDDEDDDCIISSGNIGTRRVSSIGVGKPRIMDGLKTDSKISGYYNWAMTAATSNVATLMNVQTCEGKTESSQRQSKRRKIPVFQLLSGQS